MLIRLEGGGEGGGLKEFASRSKLNPRAKNTLIMLRACSDSDDAFLVTDIEVIQLMGIINFDRQF